MTGPVPSGETRRWLNPMQRTQIDQAIERVLRDAGWDKAAQDDAAMRPLVDLVAALVVEAERRGARTERKRIAGRLRTAVKPTDRGFVRADDPETTRWMEGWDEARAVALACALDGAQ